MKVLSLFDGISCGMVAFERCGIPVEKYSAFEIDKYAIEISKKNYPQIEHCGDVFSGNFEQFKGYDILIGGSPCTYWSIAKANRETTPDGMGGKLFMQYVKALKESGCKWFLYENNFSIHQNIKDFISEQLGVMPIVINSALVSGQSRKRCYWTNIPNITQPNDKGILLKDILEDGCKFPIDTINGKSHTIVATYGNAGDNIFSTFGGERSRQKVLVPLKNNGGQKRIYSITDTSIIVTKNNKIETALDKVGKYNFNVPNGDYIAEKLTPIETERLQTLPDNYTLGISNVQRYRCIGNGWTVNVIAHILKGLIDLI